MKLLMDLQGAQNQSRHRGIGRYTLALSRAFLARAESEHDVRLLLNARFDTPTDTLIATLGKHAEPERRILLDVPEGIRAQPGGNAWLRQSSARTMRHVIETSGAEVVWFSSLIEGYNDDAVMPDALPAGMLSVATLYDLIPLHNPNAYLGHPRVRAWYEQSVEMLRRCDLLLAISEWVRQDAIERLQLPPERVVNIGSAVDGSFHRPAPDPAASEALRRRYNITRPFVLYNGGFDARKNVAALIEAFARLPDALRASHQLVIIGRTSHEEKLQLDAVARKTALPPDSIIYTGFAPDDDLIRLYAECALFVFPSLQEGFGLPPLEAMACGAAVIASHAASLPEVIDRRDAQFDPTRVDAISARMTEVLSNPGFAAELRRYAIERAATFSWDAVAQRALDAMQNLAKKHPVTDTSSTIDPAPVITCVLAGGLKAPAWLNNPGVRIVSLPDTTDSHGIASLTGSKHVLYVADANNAELLEPIMQAHPGALLIEEAPQHLQAAPDPSVLTAAYRAGGYAKLIAVQNMDPQQADPRLIPLLEYALGVMCTDEQLPQQLRAETPATAFPPITVLPTHNIFEACRREIALAYATHPLTLETQLLDDIATLEGKPSDDDLAAIASTIVASRKPGDIPRWLVDVSGIAEKDIHTGVQRVVRSILLHWLKSPPPGVRIEPVRFSDGRYRYARSYALNLLNLADFTLPEDAVEAARGDVFVGLDWAIDTIAQAEPQLRDWHRRGVNLQFLVYDLLPITLPETFHPYARGRFEGWLRRITGIADQLICISRATAADLHHWMHTETPAYQFGKPPSVTHFPLGVDPMLGNSFTKPRKHLADAMHARPTLLMVGTIEPRKGYDQALEACDILWRDGADFNLVVVGHFGWLMEAFRTRVEGHAERDRRLFWIDDARDDELDAIYRASTALLAASWGEGYGLPLIEAAQRGLPVIARDLPVFREIMNEQARYFIAKQATELAEALQSLITSPPRPPLSSRHFPGWQESASSLACAIGSQA